MTIRTQAHSGNIYLRDNEKIRETVFAYVEEAQVEFFLRGVENLMTMYLEASMYTLRK